MIYSYEHDVEVNFQNSMMIKLIFIKSLPGLDLFQTHISQAV